MQTDPTRTTDDLNGRRRRASYRAHHRGTKELDLLIGRFADAYLETMQLSGLELFERFLAVPDPTLQDWIFAKAAVDQAEFAGLITTIRVFHGLAVRGQPD